MTCLDLSQCTASRLLLCTCLPSNNRPSDQPVALIDKENQCFVFLVFFVTSCCDGQALAQLQLDSDVVIAATINQQCDFIVSTANLFVKVPVRLSSARLLTRLLSCCRHCSSPAFFLFSQPRSLHYLRLFFIIQHICYCSALVFHRGGALFYYNLLIVDTWYGNSINANDDADCNESI